MFDIFHHQSTVFVDVCDRFVIYCMIQLFVCMRLKSLFLVHFDQCLVTKRLQTRFYFLLLSIFVTSLLHS